MPRHKCRIDREIERIKNCIEEAKEAREIRCSQEVYKNKCLLDSYKESIQELKDELDKDKNENEISEYDKLEKKVIDINLKIVEEMKNGECYFEIIKIQKEIDRENYERNKLEEDDKESEGESDDEDLEKYIYLCINKDLFIDNNLN